MHLAGSSNLDSRQGTASRTREEEVDGEDAAEKVDFEDAEDMRARKRTAAEVSALTNRLQCEGCFRSCSRYSERFSGFLDGVQDVFDSALGVLDVTGCLCGAYTTH